jgi:hypothetical protein
MVRGRRSTVMKMSVDDDGSHEMQHTGIL